MPNFITRIEKLERAGGPPEASKPVRRFIVQAPVDTPTEEIVAFLRGCGHDVCDENLNIIRKVIGSENGRPVDLELRDLTKSEMKR